MGVLHCRHHHFQHTPSCFSFATIATLTFLLLTSVVSALRLNPTRRLSGEQQEVIERVLIQRRLSGPGSSPPTCRSKCGRCSPCKPVRVSIQPGFSFTLEYYPEAWRCKCGNNLFMP
ncbi:PREDICTED: EPIDERMAL PATTERNING FACTOR-like protein 5 [Nicotiana attenuata]|uniref:Epidermal patterning factor-like protein n=1 Tax=Nicotiana attenuata TaxID=49451 RepID=A0A1J6IUQ3_NICAT|nr:PREDICTED: EPIDERMAL PATTERNING FACTOR-like protein 5 [Nicotiana attenuata]OIS98864.1 epidermal patterning factor-like protein 4 [Nicotiana attenuata]